MSFLNIGRLAFRPKTGLVIFIRIDRNKDLHQPKWWKPLKIPVWISYHIYLVSMSIVYNYTPICIHLHKYTWHMYRKIKTSSIGLADLEKLILDLHTLYINRSSSSKRKYTDPRGRQTSKHECFAKVTAFVSWLSLRRLEGGPEAGDMDDVQRSGAAFLWDVGTGKQGWEPRHSLRGWELESVLTPSWRVCFISWLKGMFLLVVVNLNFCWCVVFHLASHNHRE